MSNITILGGGYVGQAMARFWAPTHTVTITTTTPDRVSELQNIAHAVRVVRGDDTPGLHDLLQHQHTLLVCAGAPHPDAYEETYLRTAQTLAQVLDQVPSVEQVIYTGSYAVYGNQQGAWVDETTPIAPADANGEILAQTEQVLLSAATSKRRVCVFRLGGIYGPGRELAKIYQRFAGKTRPGKGDDAINWVHLDDILGAIDFAQQHHLSGLYNLVGDTTWTSRELWDRVATAHELPPVSWDATASSARPYNAKVSNRKLKATGYSFIRPEIDVLS